jgi:integrase
VLTATEAQAILDACEHLRDCLLFAVLLDCGVGIGEALGLRHEDMGIAELMRLYADYLTREYGSLDSDYVFVNLWSQPYGRRWTYAAVYDLVLRLRERTGIDFGPHQYRHSYATWLLRRGSWMETVKECLGHASITTTIDTYGHLTVEDARDLLHQVYNRLLRLLAAADQRQAPPGLRRALTVIHHHVDDHIARVRLKPAA